MRWNFILLHLDEFDAILRMDGLSHYRANINYFERQVELEREGEKKIIFIEEDRKIPIKIISMMKVEKYLRKGCEAYLASVIKDRKEGVKLKELPIVNEFEDVFPEDLPGLPPEREIEFEIKLIPGTAFISQSPYRMAPAVLKELKMQLQELLDEGFI